MKRSILALVALLAASATAAAPAAGPDLRIANDVVLTRPDGTVIPMTQTLRVSCGPWDEDVRKPSIHIRAGGGTALWTLSAVVADVKRKPVVRFPHSFVFDKPAKALLFAADATNEVSTAEEESSGKITFTRVRCGKRLDVRFKVDAVMGSEFHDGAPLRIRGSFSARG